MVRLAMEGRGGGIYGFGVERRGVRNEWAEEKRLVIAANYSGGESSIKDQPGKTANVIIGVWYNEDSGEIHLRLPEHGLSTINSDADKRGHPHLYNKFAKVLRDKGKSHPKIVEEWVYGRRD